jgi:sensor domain CHASE-containing protein
VSDEPHLLPCPFGKPQSPESELVLLIRDALTQMKVGSLHSGPQMERQDFKAIAGVVLERFETLRALDTKEPNKADALAKAVVAWNNGLRHKTPHEARMVKMAKDILAEGGIQ